VYERAALKLYGSAGVGATASASASASAGAGAGAAASRMTSLETAWSLGSSLAEKPEACLLRAQYSIHPSILYCSVL